MRAVAVATTLQLIFNATIPLVILQNLLQYSHNSYIFHFIDADECALGLDNCHSNAYCTDYEYGFSCTCLTGYSGNGTYCESQNISHTLS